MGHYCRICGRSRANEKSSGRGHRQHVCKDCRKMPREKRRRIECLDELHDFLHQSNISAKNLKRLKELGKQADPEVAILAALILDIAHVQPRKRHRWLNLARRHRHLFTRAIEMLGIEFFEDLLGDYGDFESPLWNILEKGRIAPPWTARSCDCGSRRAFRNCCLERENELWDNQISLPFAWNILQESPGEQDGYPSDQD